MQNTNRPQAEKIDDKQFHQIAAQLLHSIELSLEHADEALDLDLDIARQGGNVINIAFHDRSVIVVNTQPLFMRFGSPLRQAVFIIVGLERHWSRFG